MIVECNHQREKTASQRLREAEVLSTSHIFFEAIASYLERMGVTRSLMYFSRHHIEIEKRHEVFEKQMNDFLASLVLSEEERASARALVDRAYAAFTSMFDDLEHLLASRSGGTASGRAASNRILVHEERRSRTNSDPLEPNSLH